MSDDLDKCFDDGDSGGPTSHRYLYTIDRDELFAMFVGAVNSLKVDDDGAHCLSAEAQGLSRMARAVENRADTRWPRESALAGVATVLRVLLARTDMRDRGEDEYYYGPMAELVGYFLRLRAALGDMLVATGVWRSPVPVPDSLSGLDAAPRVTRAADGRLWAELDPGDEVTEDSDQPTAEGGYLWHTDGRPPEPIP